MKVILTEDIKGVGKKDEIINASDGYARNFLLPKKKALEATQDNLNKLKAKQNALQNKKAKELEEAKNSRKDENNYFKNKSKGWRKWKNFWWSNC